MILGFIGTGKITSSVVTGICKSKISFKKILLSPRNRTISNKLSKKFRKVSVAKNKVSHFVSAANNVEYYIALEPDTK